MDELARFIEGKMKEVNIQPISLSKKVGCSDVYVYKVLHGRNVSEGMLLNILEKGLMCTPAEIIRGLLLNLFEKEPRVKEYLGRFLKSADKEYDPELHKLEALGLKAKKKKMLSKLIQLAEAFLG